jgi:hypothetical protein
MSILCYEGSLDLFPKIGYEEMESQVGDEPIFMWWGTWVIELNESAELPNEYAIVENLDSFAKKLIIKELRIKTPILINKGVTPCVASVAEQKPPTHGKWVHVGLYKDRLKIAESYKILKKLCANVQMSIGFNSVGILHVEIN